MPIMKSDLNNLDELRKMLQRGMGRAILFLMEQDLACYRDLILDNCLHNYAYDGSIEDPRAQYLYPLIKATGELDSYRSRILGALFDEKDSWDADHLCDFAILFARDGSHEAREALYEKVRRNDTDHALTGSEQLIQLEGTSGLLLVLDIIGKDPGLSSWRDGFYIRDTEETSSVEEVRMALQQAASSNPNIAAALSRIEDYSTDWTAEEIARRREERRERLSRSPVAIGETTTWEEVKASPHFGSITRRWANVASQEELEKAARDLDPQDEPERLCSHISMFDRYPFPLDPDPLIRLVDHPDDKVAISALSALELVEHPVVRELFQQISTGHRWSDRAIGLLRSNYKDGDHEVICQLLERAGDEDALHLMAIHVREVYRDNPVPEGLQPLVLAYEKTPCSACRYWCVTGIRDIGSVPDWMIRECLHDAYGDTRELVASLASPS